MPDAEGHPNPEEMELQAVMKALSDPLRYLVVATLAAQPEGTERSCTSFGLPPSPSRPARTTSASSAKPASSARWTGGATAAWPNSAARTSSPASRGGS